MKRLETRRLGTRRPGMTCHGFQRQMPDWVGRRLSPEHSEAMAAHERECVPCRRAAQAEADLRQCFRETVPPALPDIWPHLALHLETKASAKTGPFSRRWAVAAAVLMLALAASWSHLPGNTGAGRSETAGFEEPLPAPALTASSRGSFSHRKAPAWLEIGNAAPDDPAVDDPVGPNMETLWTCLNTDK